MTLLRKVLMGAEQPPFEQWRNPVDIRCEVHRIHSRFFIDRCMPYFFKCRITNAFIEGLNNRIETLKRKRYGLRNKERFIKNIIFAFSPIVMFLTNLIFTH